MTLAALFRKDTAQPAAAALEALRERTTALQQDDATWADRELAAVADIRSHDEAVTRLQSFEEKHLQAVADREVGLPNAVDPDLIEVRIDEERARADRLASRRKVAERMLVRIRAERQRIREEMTALAAQHPACVHAAVVEHLHSLAPAFLEAERKYLDMLSQVYGASRLADRIAREQMQTGRPHLGWSGDVNTRDIFTPRPQGAEFNPVPQRDAIHHAIEAEAARLREELK